MAELTPAERLQPCLLDRLTDKAPGTQHESRDRRIISPGRYRDGVLRDLGWLMNTGARRPEPGEETFKYLPQSVLSYGIPDLCGLTVGSINLRELERLIRQALLAFEPRILRHSLRVRAVTQDAQQHNTLSFEIECELWAQPIPEALFIKTNVDLDTGILEVQESAHG
jgi:type VI secretion system protein ImpF